MPSSVAHAIPALHCQTRSYTHPHSGTRKPQAAVNLPEFMSSASMSEQQLADRLEPLLSRLGAVCGPSGPSGRETRIDLETVSHVVQMRILEFGRVLQAETEEAVRADVAEPDQRQPERKLATAEQAEQRQRRR
jgi:hypothetical protein